MRQNLEKNWGDRRPCRDAVLDHMLQNKFLSDKQHGFVHSRSCTTPLLKVIDIWTEILDQGGAIDSLYLDFAKALDSVPHERLVLKLASYGIEGHVLQWIQHLLSGRRQRVAVAGAFSTWIDVLSGVPPGSVLGPILFVCFISDMPDVMKSFLYIYAIAIKYSERLTSCMKQSLYRLLTPCKTGKASGSSALIKTSARSCTLEIAITVTSSTS